MTAPVGGGRAALLPQVLGDVPVAILLLDLLSGEVTYANPAAVDLAGDVRLPVPIDDWGRAAGLLDLGGDALAESSSPLSRIATGHSVAGERVRVSRVGASTASGAPIDDSLLWGVTGFPVATGAGRDQLALVAFFEVSGGPIGGAACLTALRDRAVIATELSFTISDPHQPDAPLIWANPAFTRMTGYELSEVVGTNCRFLQGGDDDQEPLEELRDALAEERPVTVVLLNYRKDGTAFYNQLSVSPVFDGEGRLVNYVGVQADVTARVLAEREREAAHQAERIARAEAETARADAERSRAALAMLAEATSLLAGTLDAAEALDRLARLAVPMLADWCVINLLDETDGSVRRSVVLRDSQHREELLARFAELEPGGLTPESPVARVLAGEGPVVMAVDRSVVRGHVEGDELLDVTDELGLCSAMIVPLKARSRVLGTVALVSGVSGRVFDETDLAIAADLARRAALAVDNARVYEREHRVAEALQRSLLPDLPVVPGLEHAAVYQASGRDAEVGGDFYDVLVLPDGATGLVIGDVMGHDLVAAAAMGQLRGVLRSYAYEGSAVGTVLDRTDALVQGLGVLQMATVIYGRLERHDAGGAWLTWANAGHVPPLLVEPDGTTRWLDAEPDPVLGVPGAAPRVENRQYLAAGSTLVLCTDGLVERRGIDLEEGLDAMRSTVCRLGPQASPGVMAAGILAAAPPGGDDDVALLVLRIS